MYQSPRNVYGDRVLPMGSARQSPELTHKLWGFPEGVLRRLAAFFVILAKAVVEPAALCDSCGLAELSRGDADDALEVVGELALIREADPRGDLRQGQLRLWLQELLRPPHPSRDDVLVRRHADSFLELAGEVKRAQLGDGGQLPQGDIGVEVFLDLLDDGPEPDTGQRSVVPELRRAGPQAVTDQLDGQHVGQGLGA